MRQPWRADLSRSVTPQTGHNDCNPPILYAENKKTNIETERDESRPFDSRPTVNPPRPSQKEGEPTCESES